ncbi:GH36 C-terminal domain-containing protein [Cohnella nanjingensis]|uniref:GH36 C-terminal domain-containing protein n=1 Tax=Cohnella nanjingensis TaxID=1387779 RepID=A0A7X0RNP7_9BACL|nr:GH36 C-terminal domain-containing protein [Cohnella nanjingensis]MBB6670790.1 GH36 C-terminal domain-containing protein [Cohnella nanjingensis]
MITYESSWTASAGYSTTTQGANEWYYQQRPIGGGAYTNLTFAGGAWRSGSGNWIKPSSMHPDNSYDAVRKWVAPQSGVVSIKGNVRKIDTGGGNGIVASVLRNSNVLWEKTVAYNDAAGYWTDAELGNVPVTAGDALYFIVGNNGDWAYDETGWDPTVTYVSTAPEWALSTDDTSLTLTVRDSRPAIIGLSNPEQGWNWTPSASLVPLLDKVTVSETAYHPNWTYTGATVDTTSGMKVTLAFQSTTPNLTLTQVWRARPGVGPVEMSTAVTNNTGGSVTYNHQDIVSAELNAVSDSPATIWRFNRSSYNNGRDPNFDTGVFKDLLGTNANMRTTIGNDYNPSNYQLPFEMLDVNGAHGLYMGYVWDFGRISNTTGSDAKASRNRFYLGDSGSFSVANGGTLNIPGMFYGTYKGDTDDGSNKMKKWFWNYKVPSSLRSNENEPLVEFSVDAYDEASITSFLSSFPLSTWGVELLKEDAWWTSDVNTDPFFGWAWSPAPNQWPNGMTLGTIAHNNGLQLSLYMGNRYDHADLSTQAGRDAQKHALLTRYDDWHYDYWRSDMETEPTNDYLSHEGFLEVLDYMIANRPSFRWENCSAGGSKKSFDLLQRQTVMTLEDSGAGSNDSVLNYRKAVYANSYMINSVQMKDDNGYFSTNTNAWAKYMFRSGFLGAWMYGSDGPSNVPHQSQYQSHVALYKTKQRPILRGADVYHVLPMPDGTNWDGLEFFNTSLNKGSVVLFKPNSNVTGSPTIYLKGLDPSATYTLTFEDRPSLNKTMTGAQLMAGGAGISISGASNDYDSEIVWIN